MTFKPGESWRESDDHHETFTIDEPTANWSQRIHVYGSAALRDHIVKLLNENPMPPEPEPEQVVRYVTLFQDEEGRLWANCEPKSARPVYAQQIARTRVILTPGQFDDENTPDPYTKGWNEALEAVKAELEARRRNLADWSSPSTGLAESMLEHVRALKRSAP